jgi:hypothetical protein
VPPLVDSPPVLARLLDADAAALALCFSLSFPACASAIVLQCMSPDIDIVRSPSI